LLFFTDSTGVKDSTKTKDAVEVKDSTKAKDSTEIKESTKAKDSTGVKESTKDKGPTSVKDSTKAKTSSEKKKEKLEDFDDVRASKITNALHLILLVTRMFYVPTHSLHV